MNKIQTLVWLMYQKREYTSDLLTLALGVCEEAGEVAKAVNAHHNPEYKLSPYSQSDSQSDSLEHELVNLMTYTFGLANAAGIDMEAAMMRSLLGLDNRKDTR
jgi:NTP pyrophosphatase (non-canonical NTP hydrolase)